MEQVEALLLQLAVAAHARAERDAAAERHDPAKRRGERTLARHDFAVNAASSLSVAVALVAAALLTVLLAPPTLLSAASTDWDKAKPACYESSPTSCPRWQATYAYAAGTAVVLAMVALIFALAVTLGIIKALPETLLLFALSLSTAAVAVLAAVWLSFSKKPAVFFTVLGVASWVVISGAAAAIIFAFIYYQYVVKKGGQKVGTLRLSNTVIVDQPTILQWVVHARIEGDFCERLAAAWNLAGDRGRLPCRIVRRIERTVFVVLLLPALCIVHLFDMNMAWARRKLLTMLVYFSDLDDTRNNYAALHVAAAANAAEVAYALLSAGADPSICAGPLAATPLHLAAQEGSLKVVKHLVSFGADLDAVADIGMNLAGVTPVCIAATSPLPESLEIVKTLLAGDADPQKKDAAGATPSELAARLTYPHSPKICAELGRAIQEKTVQQQKELEQLRAMAQHWTQLRQQL